jgi:hypothetical protein
VQIVNGPEVEADMSGSEINDEFLEQFCFQLTAGEYGRLKSQIVTLDSAGEFDYPRSQNATIEHIFQKGILTFSKSSTASGLYLMKLQSNLLRNIEEIEAELIADEITKGV